MGEWKWCLHVDNPKEVDVGEVVHFFCCTIKGIWGGGKARNLENLREIIETPKWYLADLCPKSLGGLLLPDAMPVLLENKQELTVKTYWTDLLKKGHPIPPLIVKRPRASEPNASFEILDGSGRAQSHWVYAKNGSAQCLGVQVYVGVDRSSTDG